MRHPADPDPRSETPPEPRDRDLERHLRSLAPVPPVPGDLAARILAARADEGPRQRLLRATRYRRATAAALAFRLFGDPWLHVEHQLRGARQAAVRSLVSPLHLLRDSLSREATHLSRQIADPLRAACRPLRTCLAPQAPH
ncbi:MAG: hypothetical protein ABIL09_05210 [Gemmatimonadota bacterium]